MIADEPTTALDVTVQAEVLDLLRSLQAELNMGVILVTHNFGVVADICDRVSVMRDGRVVETGPVRSIFYHPEHPYTQTLLGDILQEEEPRGPLVAAGRHRDQHRHDRQDGQDARSAGMTELLLDAKDVVVEYPVKGFRKQPFKALKGVSLDIRPGEIRRPGRRVRFREDHSRPGGARPGAGHRRAGALPGPGHRAAVPEGTPRRCRRRSRWCSRTRTPR